MKRLKLFAILSAVVLALAFAGCKGTTDGPDNSGNTGNQENGGNQGTGGNQESYTITIADGIRNGTVTADKTTAHKDEIVTLTIPAVRDYELQNLSVKDASSNDVSTTAVTPKTTYTFVMPESNVTVNASFIYKFHESVTTLPAGTDGTAGTSATYVLFGDWPQTVKAEGVEVDDDDNAETTITRGGFRYYLGSDDNYYVKCSVHRNGNNNTYSNGQPLEISGQQYFKVEPIKWRVLTNNYDEGKKLLLAENVLTSGIRWYLYSGERTLDEDGLFTVYANNYKYSTIRAYLNGSYVSDDIQQKTYENVGFLQSAFSTSAQGLIQEVTVDNSLDSTKAVDDDDEWWGGRECQDTRDKIFLLSENEVTDGNYGFDNFDVYVGHGTETSSRVRKPTDYALANYAAMSTQGANYGNWWMTRSGTAGTQYFMIRSDGKAKDGQVVTGDGMGVVPALCIN